MKTLVYLRALEPSDMKQVHMWHNNPELYSNLGDSFRFVSEVTEAAWIQQKSSSQLNEVNLAICEAATGRHVGNIYLRGIDWISRRAVFHMLIGSAQDRGKGLGANALSLVLDYAFQELNLHRVELEVLSSNETAIRIYERAGFVKEGIMRGKVFKNGSYHDLLSMAILRHEYVKA